MSLIESHDLAATTAVYCRTRSYQQALDKERVETVPQLDQWAGAVSHALAALEARIEHLVTRHEVWSWIIDRVDANPIATARLLVRLNPDRANSPSSFWSYCGLATIPGVELACDRCRHVIQQTSIRSLSCTRPTGARSRPCGGSYRSTGTTRRIRIAQRWSRSAGGPRGLYDPEARTAAFLIGHDLLARSTHYGQVNRTEVGRLLAQRPSWTHQHRLRAARRRTTKEFLADLWKEWRTVRGLPTRPGTPPSRAALEAKGRGSPCESSKS